MWFPGVHSNIGGGYVCDGLANGALEWITDKSQQHGLKLDKSFLKFYRAYPQDTLYPSNNGFYVISDWLRRRTGQRSIISHGANANVKLHYSVITRMLGHPDEKNAKTGKLEYPRLTLYRPPNVIAFLQQRPDPLTYCIDLLKQSPGGSPDEKTLAKLKSLLKEIAI